MKEKRQVLYTHEDEGQQFLAKGKNHIFVTMPDNTARTARVSWGTRTVSLQFKSPNPENEHQPWVPYRAARFHREFSRQTGQNREVISDIPAAIDAEGIIEFEAASGVYYRLVVTGSDGAGPVATIVAISENVRRVG